MKPAHRTQRGHLHPRRRTALGSVVGVSIALIVGVGAAFGYWVGTDSSTPAQADAAALSAPNSPSANATSSTAITVGWSLPIQQLSGAKYQVTRTSGLGSPVTVCTVTTTSCPDSALIPGTTYGYSIEAVLPGTSWVSSSITASTSTPKVTPSISTQTSSASVTVGSSLTDQATVSGGYSPGGTITWKVYASTDSNCTGTVYFTSSAQTVSGDTNYTSSSFGTTAVGSYKWGFSYTGDTSNNAVSGCGGTNESFTVTQATTSLSTSASTNVSVGLSVSDAATLSNGYNPTGTITYTLYGPSPTQSCTTQVGQVTKSVTSGNGNYTSPTITPTQAGTYWWIANYGGDSNNTATTNGCGATGESSVINKVTPTITTTTGSASFAVGGSVSDTATFSLGYSATGTITWKVYASSDTSCATPLFSYSSTATVSGNGSYSPAASVTPTSVGSYIWGFSYGGDVSNSAVSGCGGSNESFTVNKASPTLSVSASSNVTAGTPITPSATLASGFLPSGTITFYVSGPGSNPASCPGTMTLVGTAAVNSGNASYNSNASYTPTVVGNYWWYASYGGDGNNASAATLCNSASMTKTVVAQATPSVSATGPSTGTVGTAISTSSISSLFANSSGSNAGGTITFKVFGPLSSAPTNCSAGTTWTGNTASVSGNNTYHPSGAFTPSSAGDYWWYASYGGDGNNAAETSTCGSGMSETVVAAPTTLTFSSAGTYAVTVPAGVTSLTFTLEGAGGGGGGGYSGYPNGGTGGAGGKITGTITLASNPTGTVLDLVVGGAGTGGSGNGTGTGGTGGPGGSAAGGNGGTSTYSGGGGGGGASEIYVTSSTPIALAGGGAGGGALANSTAGNGTGSGGAGPIGNGAAGSGGSSNGGGAGGGGYPHGSGGSVGGTGSAGGNGTGGSGYDAGQSGYTVSGATPTTGGGGAGGAGGTSSNSYNGGTGGSGYAQLVGAGLTIVPTVAVTDNAPVQAGSTLTFTATVTAPSGDPTPTGTMGWAITPPGGGSTSCSSTTGPTGASNVATYTCSINSAIDGTYSATANYPGDSNYTSASGSDTATVYTPPTYVGVGAATTWTTNTAKSVAYPSGAASGDLLLLMIAFSNNTASVGLSRRLDAKRTRLLPRPETTPTLRAATSSRRQTRACRSLRPTPA